METNLFNTVEHSDVTIVCDDGKQVKAHTFILSASSPFFRNIFSIDCEPSCMIYLQGVASDDLTNNYQVYLLRAN